MSKQTQTINNGLALVKKFIAMRKCCLENGLVSFQINIPQADPDVFMEYIHFASVVLEMCYPQQVNYDGLDYHFDEIRYEVLIYNYKPYTKMSMPKQTIDADKLDSFGMEFWEKLYNDNFPQPVITG